MKPFVKFGLWTGIVSGLWSLGSFTVVGWLNSSVFRSGIAAAQIRSYSGLFSILILVLGIYLGMKRAKMNDDNSLAYGRAVKIGLIITCITAPIVAIFSYFYCTAINPGYADFMVNDARHTLAAAGKTSLEISQKLDGVRKEFSTASQVGMALIGQAVVGSIVSLILALFMRTKKSRR